MRLVYVLIGVGVVVAAVIAIVVMSSSPEPVVVAAPPPPLPPDEVQVQEPDGGFRPKPDLKVRLRQK